MHTPSYAIAASILGGCLIVAANFGGQSAAGQSPQSAAQETNSRHAESAATPVGWRRTVNGWERAESWLYPPGAYAAEPHTTAIHSPDGTWHRPARMIHPTALIGLLLLVAYVLYRTEVVSPAPAGSRKSPVPE